MKENLRKLLCMMLAVLLLAALAAPALAAETAAVGVKVSGKTVQWTDAEPFIDESRRTMVPLRAVAEALGLSVSWDGVKREAVFTNGVKTLYFPIGSTAARTGDGGTVKMDTAAVIVNRRTFAPVRYLAEYFGYTVEWDGKTRTVMIQPEYRLLSVVVSATDEFSYYGTVRFPDGSTEYYNTGTTNYSYNEDGSLLEAVYRNTDGAVTSTESFMYDNAGHEIKTVTYYYQTGIYTDSDGKIHSDIGKDVKWRRECQNTYDQNGNLIRVIERDIDNGFDENTSEYEYEYEYDADGNLIRWVYDEDYYFTTYEYNDSRQLVKELVQSDAPSILKLYSYDNQGRVRQENKRELYSATDTEYQYGEQGAWLRETVRSFSKSDYSQSYQVNEIDLNNIDSPPADTTRTEVLWNYKYDSEGHLISVERSTDGSHDLTVLFKYGIVGSQPEEDKEGWIKQYQSILSKNYTAAYSFNGSWYYTDYTLYDINKDGIPELLVRPANKHNWTIDVYTFVDSQAMLCGSIDANAMDGPAWMYDHPTGLLYYWSGMGRIRIDGYILMELIDNKLVQTLDTYSDGGYERINNNIDTYPRIENFYRITDMSGFES